MDNVAFAKRTLSLAAKALLLAALLASPQARAQTAPRNCVACQWEEYHRGMRRDLELSQPSGPGLFESFFQGLAEGKREPDRDLAKEQSPEAEMYRAALALSTV